MGIVKFILCPLIQQGLVVLITLKEVPFYLKRIENINIFSIRIENINSLYEENFFFTKDFFF